MTRKEMESVKTLHDMLDEALSLAYACASRNEESGKWDQKGDDVKLVRMYLWAIKKQLDNYMWTQESDLKDMEFIIRHPWTISDWTDSQWMDCPSDALKNLYVREKKY